jgi:hypothetical protein
MSRQLRALASEALTAAAGKGKNYEKLRTALASSSCTSKTV